MRSVTSNSLTRSIRESHDVSSVEMNEMTKAEARARACRFVFCDLPRVITSMMCQRFAVDGSEVESCFVIPCRRELLGS